MNKTLGIIALLAILAIGAVYAYNAERPAIGEYRDQMEQILEEGTYADLEAFREEIGFSVMPRVTDEETFALMKERHAQQEQFREENGPAYRAGMKRGMLRGMRLCDQ
ncbi:hypothetical protein C4573_05975 [Candidatus Woesearchaeota archaeon]|nr:MAG: hypothetical protein C4573_05975 [Candidatus Woesearchaeota archaeon]